MAVSEQKFAPEQYDEKYRREDGSYDYEAWLADYNKYLDDSNADRPGPSPDMDDAYAGTGAYADKPGAGTGAIAPDPIAPSGGKPGGGRKESHWWESPTDDSTNDGGTDWASAVFEDSETKQFSAEAQAGMGAAKAAGDEAGYNGIKDAERARLAGQAGYSAATPPPNPGVAGGAAAGKPVNVTGATDATVAGMTMADVLKLIGNPAGYAEELGGYDPDEQQGWIDAVMRGDTAAGNKVVEEARRRLKGQ